MKKNVIHVLLFEDNPGMRAYSGSSCMKMALLKSSRIMLNGLKPASSIWPRESRMLFYWI